MNFIYRALAGSMLTVAITMIASNSVEAENRLYIPPFTVSGPSVTATVVLDIDEQSEVGAFNFDVQLPEGFKLSGVRPNDERFTNGQVINFNDALNGDPQLARVLVASFNQSCFNGKEGAIVYLDMQVDMNEYKDNLYTRTLSVYDINLNNPQTLQNWQAAGSETTVTIGDVSIDMTAEKSEMVFNPGGDAYVTVGMDNNTDVLGLQFDVRLPEGFSLEYDSKYHPQRWSNGAFMTVTKLPDNRALNTWRFQLIDLSGGNAVQGRSGEVAGFTVVTPDGYAGDTALVEVVNVIGSVYSNDEWAGEPETITLVNGAKAYEAANKTIEALRAELAAALGEIAENCPDVKDEYTGAEIESEINALAEAVEAAYNDLTLTPAYETVMAPATTIQDAINAMVKAAGEAQAAHEKAEAEKANNEAYANASVVLDGLRGTLEAARERIATECPDVAAEFPVAPFEQQIDAMSTAVEEAYKNMTLVADYDSLLAPVAEIQAGLDALVSDAVLAQAEFEKQEAEKANEQALVNAAEVLDNLQAVLEEAAETIATECPDVAEDFPLDAYAADIESVRAAVEEAYKNMTLVTDYEAIMAPVPDIEADIKALVDAAVKAQAEHESNALEAAYAEGQAVVSQLRLALAEALNTIAADCPDVKDRFNGNLISVRIDNLRDAVSSAYTNKTLAKNYDEVIAPAAEIGKAIAALVDEAKEAQKMFDADKANAEAYMNANAVLADLEAKATAAQETIAAECPDVAANFPVAAYISEIETVRAAVEEAFAAGTLVEEYDAILAPAARIEADLDALVEAAKAAQNEFVADKANAEAYGNANAVLADLEAKVTAAQETIATECPDVAADFPVAAYISEIETVRAAVEEAFAGKTLVEEYDAILAPAARIEADLDALVEAAKEAQAEFEKGQAAEAERQARNLEAYNDAMDEVDALQDALNEAIAIIVVDYPGYDVEKPSSEIQDRIDDIRKAVEEAYEAVAEEGEFDYTVSSTEVLDMIVTMKADAIVTGVDMIMGEALDKDVMIFTLDGVKVAAPVHGQTNVVVYPDGRIRKVFVK